MKTPSACLGLAAAFLAGLLPAAAQDATYPERPGDREFIVDEVELISLVDRDSIRKTADALLTEKAVPIIVVTIPGLAFKNADALPIEQYARGLFDAWSIGYEKWNHGILLLISVADRKARIELGADWGHGKDADCSLIMNSLIIPEFKRGRYSVGIVNGVEALDKMARGLEIPKPKTPAWVYFAWIGFAGLAVFTIVSLIRRGASGWAWLFWGVVFSIVGYLLVSAMRSRSGGGGFSGGSFGGGFSGGGGATGSW